METDPRKWLSSVIQLWGGESIFILALGVATLLAGITAFLLKNTRAASWSFVLSVFFLALSLFKKYQENNKKTCVFIPDEVRSFWHHAPQPDGRELTQFGLKGSVTNTTDHPLHLCKIKLLSPKSKRQYQEFIFTVHNNRVDTGEMPLVPNTRTDFDTCFFAEGLLGKKGKSLSTVVSVCDQFGNWHKIKFSKLRDIFEKN